MRRMPGAFLEDLTWPEAEARFKAGEPVLIPIGAAAKEHGAHLPLSTDHRLARELARRVAEYMRIVIAPVVPFGYYPAFVGYPGSQHLSADTFIRLVAELVGNFIDQGVTRIAILNTGISTEAPLEIAARRILDERQVRIHVADVSRLGRATDKLLKQRMGGHADERETSVMLAIAPSKVRLGRARKDYGHAPHATKTAFRAPVRLTGDPADADWSATGAFGDPTLATAKKGRAILDAMVFDLLEGLNQIFPDHRH
jgi:creatinine amidohydrolase